MKRYSIEVNEAQLVILASATELYARLRTTQLNEIEQHLPKAFWKLPHDVQMEFREKIRDLEHELRGLLGLSQNAGYGVCSAENTGESCDVAFDLNEVFRHEIWHSRIDDDPEVSAPTRSCVMAYPAHRWAHEPLATITALQDPVRKCSPYGGCEIVKSANVCASVGAAEAAK